MKLTLSILFLLFYLVSFSQKEVKIIVPDTFDIFRGIQDYGSFQISRKCGNKYYLNPKKKNNKKATKQFKKLIGDTINNIRFIYYHNKVKIKEAGRVRDYGDIGLMKTYYENGNIKSEGVVYYLRKVGIWKYYNFNGSLLNIERYNNEEFAPSGIKYIDILGSNILYPIIK